MDNQSLSKAEYNRLVQAIPKTIRSKTGSASYTDYKVNGTILSFMRVNTREKWNLNLDELFEAYQNLIFINTVKIREYVSGNVYSAACALLIANGLYSSNGQKL